MVHLKKIHHTAKLEFFTAETSTPLTLPMAESGVSAGFPSPAEEYMELSLDFNKDMITHPASTFYARVRGNSMVDAGINDGDILVIDKSLEPTNGKKAVCYIDGEFTLKTIQLKKGILWLNPANDAYKPIRISEVNEFQIWGIVTFVIHKM
jgi:DNA polymerase V